MSISGVLGEAREARVRDAVIRYRETGSGPAIVFVHGVLVNGDLWRGVVGRLSDQYRCITPDWPLGSHAVPLPAGFDRSPHGMARLIEGFLDALDLREVTLVGNDSGGALTQLVMVHHPARLARAVITPSDCFEHFFPPTFKPLKWFGGWTGFWRLSGFALRSRALQRLPLAFGWLTRRPIPPEIMESYLAPLRADPAIRNDLALFIREIDPSITIAAGARLGEFAKPVLIIWHDSDRVFPRDDAKRLAARLPNARVKFVGGSYAFIPEDRPDVLADEIAAFMAEDARA